MIILKPIYKYALMHKFDTTFAPAFVIYLGMYDSPDNYYEITKEEYDRIIEEQEKYMMEVNYARR